MRIGVLSDTHGSSYAVKKAMQAAGKVDAWIHLGDGIEDKYLLSGVPVYAVGGNCDYDGENELVVALGGVKIYITHGHLFSVRISLQRLLYRAMELGCRAALFGHTHVPTLLKEDGILLLNPGSAAFPRGGSKCSFAVLTVDEVGNVDAEFTEIE